MMGNHRLYEIERFHASGTSESKRLKVTALNLFHPTASLPFLKVGFFILRRSLWRRGWGEGTSNLGGKYEFSTERDHSCHGDSGDYGWEDQCGGSSKTDQLPDRRRSARALSWREPGGLLRPHL